MLKKVYLTKKGKLVKFRKTVKQTPALQDTKTGKISYRGKHKLRKREFKVSGIQYTTGVENRFGRLPTKKETQILYHKAYLYIDGVKVGNLKTDDVISKKKYNRLIANLKGQSTPFGKTTFEQPDSREQFLKILNELYDQKSESILESLARIREKRSSQPQGGLLPYVLRPETVLYKIKCHNNFIDDFIVLDSEDDSKGNVKLVDIYDGVKHVIFENDDSLQLKLVVWQYLDKKYHRTGAKIFCVNLQYDSNNLFGDSWKNWKPVFSGNMLLTYDMEQENRDIKSKRKKVKFYEVMSQLRLSVEQMGELLDLHKLKVDDRIDVEYVKRDCEIPHKALRKIFDFDKKNKIEFAISLGGKSLKKFRTDYLPNSLKSRIYTEFIPAYRGGRVEIFKMQGDNVNVYDINSLYPYVMSENIYPNPYMAIKSDSFEPLGVYYVKVDIRRSSYIPILGVLREGKYIFPTGKYNGMFTGVEIIKAYEENQIKDITLIDGFKFTSIGKIFKSYIQNLYRLRLENHDDKLINNYVKYLMNSLYGKFAQKNKNIQFNEEKNVFENCVDKYPNHSNFIWSIFITAYARLELYDQLCKEAANLLYCDTDSIHLCNNKILPIADNLGALKHEGFFEHANYLQPKCYQLQGKEKSKYKVKGIPKKHREEFFKYNEVTFRRPVKIFEFLRNAYQRELNPLLKRQLVLNNWIEVKKVLRSKYDKRIIINDSGDTKPIYLRL